MAKVFETIFRISGEVAGSLFAAVQQASGALKGLKNAGTLTGNENLLGMGRLQRQLAELKRVQEAAEKYRRMLNEPVSEKGATKRLSELTRLKETLTASGFSTKDFDKALRHLTGSINDVSKALQHQKGILAAREKHQNATNDLNNGWGKHVKRDVDGGEHNEPVESERGDGKEF